MLEHHVTRAELIALEHKSRGAVVRLVHYARELRELLVALHPHPAGVESAMVQDVFDREVDAITAERFSGKMH